MDRETAKRDIKSRYAEYLKLAPKTVGGKPTYICPLCGNGTGADGTGMSIDPNTDGTQLHCFKCGFHGDIISLYMAEHGCDAKEAFNALYDYFGITIDGKPEPGQRKAPEPQQSTPAAADPLPDFTEYYRQLHSADMPETATAYLQGRGISEETAKKYWLGFDNGFVIIPVSQSFYIARNTDTASNFRYKNPKNTPVDIFNKAALYNEDRKPVFVTEGTFDALSIIEAGAQAVALNSTSNARKLLQILKEKKTRNVLIICMDKDAAGEQAQDVLTAGLRDLNIPHVVEDISGDHKDANEALTANRSAFTAAVQSAERKTIKPDNVSDYLRTSFGADTKKLQAQANRKTGFANLDNEIGSLYAGLYVVGGISSVGKTTFVCQMADQMAAAGEHVLLFSMEQSKHEMVSKCLARATAMLDVPTALTSLQIRLGQSNNNLSEAMTGFQEATEDRLNIIEGNFDSTISYIKDYTQRYIERNSARPVVIIDYLQVIQPDADPETGRKPNDVRLIVRDNMTQLKRMSRTLEVPVIVVSSVNRSNYLTPIDFESFMESNYIEFTADVVWGLQLAIMNDEIFDSEKKIKEKRERVKTAKAAMPRDIELVCLKNRYGKSGYTVQFSYYQKFDYYIPK